MNNMRRGFTMIELVFVIVIIGILAAVALPRFTGIADDARTSKLESFVGTLNRSTAPSMWSGLLRNEPGQTGKLVGATNVKYNTIFDAEDGLNTAGANIGDAQVEAIPAELSLNADGVTAPAIHNMPLAGCAVSTTVMDDAGAAAGTGRVASAKIANTIYDILCVDGSLTAAPHFYLGNGTVIVTK